MGTWSAALLYPRISRRRHLVMTSWLWNLAGLVLIIGFAAQISWGSLAFWRTSSASLLVGLVSFAYLVAAGVALSLIRFPRTDKIAVVFLSVSIAFLFVLVIVVFGRLYYSRSFLLTAYLMSLVWFSIGVYLLSRTQQLTFGLVPGGFAERLLRLEGAKWVVLSSPRIQESIDGIVIDLHQSLSPEWIRFLADCILQGIPVYHAASIYEHITGRVSLEHLSDDAARAFHSPLIYSHVKRFIDIVLVLVSLPITIPLMSIIALLIKLDSRGPVLFIQDRVGLGGKPFRMLKFRTMRTDAERGGAKFAKEADDRVTRLGRWLRKFRLDELPQFWNVLKGEMSLIGPRPEQVKFAEEFAREIPFYSYRHLVKPGITGWAQVMHGYAAGKEETREKLEYDLYYVKYLSLWLDLLIATKTIRTILTGFGAR